MKSSFEWLPVTRLPQGSELRLPLHTLVGKKPGPTLGLSAALHGNEMMPSVQIIQNILERVDPEELSGTILAVPICNPLGAGSRSRNTPGDGMNLNSAFGWLRSPGRSNEARTVTEQIAEVLNDKFLSRLNYHIDYHTGGDDHTVHMIEFANNPVGLKMARAFNMPILLRDSWGSDQMWGASAACGAECIVAECGGAGQLSEEWLERGVQGAFNVMRVLGMLPGTAPRPPRQYVVGNDDPNVHNLVIVRPKEGGLIIPEAGITARTHFDGQPIQGPAMVGKMLNLYDLSVRETYQAPFRRTLMLAGVVSPSWNYPGEITYIFADADRAEVLE